MSKAIPSPQTLRHLRRLCAIEGPIATNLSPTPTRRKPFSHAPSHSPRARSFSTTHFRTQETQSQTTPQQPKDSPLPDITNYYTLFPLTLFRGPPPTSPFDVPQGQLKREFLQLQSKYHPDKFPSGPSRQKSLALSSLLNTAYKTLSDPLLRGQYLLLYKYGIDVTTEDNSTHGNLTDKQTLVDVMEAQEALEEASSHEDIEMLMQENVARIKATEVILGQAFKDENVESAKRECVRLNYWQSLQGALKEWEPGKEVRLVH